MRFSSGLARCPQARSGNCCSRTVPALRLEDTVNLAELCNGWPLLASVVGSTLGQDVAAGARPDRAASEASQGAGHHRPVSL